MEKLFGVLMLLSLSLYAQDKISKDLDGDHIKDTLFLDRDHSQIVCSLSTHDFKESRSMELNMDDAGIRETKHGFVFFYNYMRAGSDNQFRYDKHAKKMRLICMSRYEFGNAANDGSGKSSVNLLTNNYIGEWNYYDENKMKLITMAPIKKKMHFGKIYLETFSDQVMADYINQCVTLYGNHK